MFKQKKNRIQIAQDFQVWNLIEQAGVLRWIQFDVVYQLAVDFAIASFDDSGTQDPDILRLH